MYGKIMPAVALAVLLFGCASEMTEGTAVPQKEAQETVGSGMDALKKAAEGAGTGTASAGAGSTAGAGDATAANPQDACIELCKAQVSKGADLSKGPCIGNPIEEFPKWVCDVAHSPRADVDSLPENQCSTFREGKANHFVEVGENCAVIKVY